jgi:inosine/xanthosine triphosphatase
MMIIAVGSRNPVKIAAARAGFGEALGLAEFIGVDAASQVSAQPIGDEETIRGAVNRAQAALAAVPHATYAVGLEGGVVEISEAASLYCCAWCAIVDRQGNTGLASTGRCELPPAVTRLIREESMELGEADDVVFGRANSKQGEGAVGLLTRGLIDRAAFYAPAVTMALVRFLNPEVFGRDASKGTP